MFELLGCVLFIYYQTAEEMPEMWTHGSHNNIITLCGVFLGIDTRFSVACVNSFLMLTLQLISHQLLS